MQYLSCKEEDSCFSFLVNSQSIMSSKTLRVCQVVINHTIVKSSIVFQFHGPQFAFINRVFLGEICSGPQKPACESHLLGSCPVARLEYLCLLCVIYTGKPP